MNGENIYCLMKSGSLPLTDKTRTTLFIVARDMFRLAKKRRAVKCLDAEIVIRTRFEPTLFGALTGIKFMADVDTDEGVASVEYIVRMAEIEPGIELDRMWTKLPLESYRELCDLVIPANN